MENAIKRNKDNARRIETWLLNRISLMGGKKVAMAVGVNESQVTRWKSSWVPKMAMLLAVLEWGLSTTTCPAWQRRWQNFSEKRWPQSARNTLRPDAN